MQPTSCRLLRQRAAAAGLSNVRVRCAMIEEFDGPAPAEMRGRRTRRDPPLRPAVATRRSPLRPAVAIRLRRTQPEPQTPTLSLAPTRLRPAHARARPACRLRAEGDDGGVDIVMGLHACGNATDYIIEQAVRMRAARRPSASLLASCAPASTRHAAARRQLRPRRHPSVAGHCLRALWEAAVGRHAADARVRPSLPLGRAGRRTPQAYVLSPCCIGKLAFSLAGGTSFHSRHG